MSAVKNEDLYRKKATEVYGCKLDRNSGCFIFAHGNDIVLSWAEESGGRVNSRLS